MSFPLTFVQKKNDFDFIAESINLLGNSAVVTGTLASITIVAKKSFEAMNMHGTLPTVITEVLSAFTVVGCAVVTITAVSIIWMNYSTRI